MKGENKFLVYCPKGVRTGGPEALHQVTETLISLGKYASIVWYGDLEAKDAFPEYDVPKFCSRQKTARDIAIVPEVKTDLLKKESFSKTAIFWLSVDNYPRLRHRAANVGYLRAIRRYISLRNHYRFGSGSVVDYHLFQSEYAKIWLLRNLRPLDGRIYEVSDYLSSLYRRSAAESITVDREDCIAFNPKKLGDFGEKVINSMPVEKCKPIKGLDSVGVCELLKKCKLYIDFGPHPGKDRIPREAAAAGCLVLVGQRGSAAFYGDVPLPEEYKIDLRSPCIASCVNFVHAQMENYEQNLSSIRLIRDEVVDGRERLFEQVDRWVAAEEL